MLALCTVLFSERKVPASCCKVELADCGKNELAEEPDNIYTTGCFDKFTTYLQDRIAVIVGTGITIIVVQTALCVGAFIVGLLKDLDIGKYDLHKSLHSTTPVTDKKLRIDIASIKQTISEGNVSVFWVRSKQMLADSLTKKGADASNLISVIQHGQLPTCRK